MSNRLKDSAVRLEITVENSRGVTPLFSYIAPIVNGKVNIAYQSNKVFNNISEKEWDIIPEVINNIHDNIIFTRTDGSNH